MAACLLKKLIVDMVLGSITFQRIESSSMTHRHTEIRIWQEESTTISWLLLSHHIGYGLDSYSSMCNPQGTFSFGPSSETIDMRYVKLVTILSFCSLTLFSLWMPLLLFVISWVFSAHISILYLVQILSRLSSKASSSCSTSTILSVIAMGRPQIGNKSSVYTSLSFMVSLSIRYYPFEKKC